MSVRERLVERLTAGSADATTVECPVCGEHYQREPLNCSTCGNTRFE